MSKIIQDYLLKDIIGEGQFGKVWKAENSKTGGKYAIKAISLKKVNQVKKMREFLNSEIQVLDIVEHENIVKYYGKLQTQNNIYLIFEYCTGGTLEEKMIAKKRLPEGQAVNYFSQLLSAFEKLNSMNIMHRDIKPSNILFDDKDTLKLADFGFCKKLRGRYEMTRSIVGSPIYMAPELLQGRYYGTKADIWSLGVMFYEMLYGRCPYEENSIPLLLDLIRRKPLNLEIGASSKVKSLLLKMLKMMPTERITWRELFQWNRELKRNKVVQKRLGRDSLDILGGFSSIYGVGKSRIMEEPGRNNKNSETAATDSSMNIQKFQNIVEKNKSARDIFEEKKSKENSKKSLKGYLKKGAILDNISYGKNEYGDMSGKARSKLEGFIGKQKETDNLITGDIRDTKKLISDLSILGCSRNGTNSKGCDLFNQESGKSSPRRFKKGKHWDYNNSSILENMNNRSHIFGVKKDNFTKASEKILQSDIACNRLDNGSNDFTGVMMLKGLKEEEEEEDLKKTKYLDLDKDQLRMARDSNTQEPAITPRKLSDNVSGKPPLNPNTPRRNSRKDHSILQIMKLNKKMNFSKNNGSDFITSSRQSRVNSIHNSAIKKGPSFSHNNLSKNIAKIPPILEKINSKLKENHIDGFPIQDISLIWESFDLRKNQECYQIMQNRKMGQMILSLALQLLKFRHIPVVKNTDDVLDLEIVVNNGTGVKVDQDDHEKLLLFTTLEMFKKARKFLLTTKIKASYADIVGLGNHLMDPRTLITSVRKESEGFDQLYTNFLKKIGKKSLKFKFKEWKGFKTKDFDFEILEVTEEDFQESIKSPFEYNTKMYKKLSKVMKDSLLEQHHYLYKEESEKSSAESGKAKRIELLKITNQVIDSIFADSFWIRVVDSMDKQEPYNNWIDSLLENELLIFLKEKLKVLEMENMNCD